MNGFWAVAKKEAMHLLRDRASIILALLLPVFQVCMYGYAIDFDVRHITTVLVDQDRSRESREYAQELRATQYLDFAFHAATSDEAAQLLKSNRASAAVIIPPNFGRLVAAGGNPQVGVMLDGSDSQVALRARLAFFRPGRPSPGDPVASTTVLFNPNSRTSTFMIPGLIGFILQLVLSSLTSGSIVREREQGSLEQLMVTPVGKYGLMLGKLAPFLVLALFEMVGVLALGWFLFDVEVRGSLILLFLMSFPFILAALGLGLLISTLARTQAQALQLSTLFFLPSILMSGFIFPRETMPGFLRLISEVLPLTHQLRILRGIVVRGAGFMDLWPSFVGTCLIAAGLIFISTRKFQKSVA